MLKRDGCDSPFSWKRRAARRGYKPGGFNIACRLGVERASKLRACDDLKHSLTNAACVTETPIRMASRAHLSQLCKRCCSHGRDWALLKVDREAAYKHPPLGPRDQPLAIIDPRDPKSGKWVGLPSRNLVSGATEEALRCDASARLIAALANRLMGITPICFFDDFASLIPAEMAQNAIASFASFFPLLGIALKPGKSAVGPAVTFPGLRGWPPLHRTSTRSTFLFQLRSALRGQPYGAIISLAVVSPRRSSRSSSGGCRPRKHSCLEILLEPSPGHYTRSCVDECIPLAFQLMSLSFSGGGWTS